MKVQSTDKPDVYAVSGRELRIHWGIRQVTREGMEGPETYWEAYEALARPTDAYPVLVESIIRSQYTTSQELAAINSGGERYQAFLDFRQQAKALARGWLGMPEPSVADQRAEAVLTRARFKLALLEGGYLDAVEAAYPSWPRNVQIMWDDSSTFERMHPALIQLAEAMGYSSEQMDAIFGITPPPINVNTATQAELTELSGVGATTANAIIAGRPWSDTADLSSISGVSDTMVGSWNITA